MYRLNHVAYCGMPGVPEYFDDPQDARKDAAERLRRYRRRYAVTTLERGKEWEIMEPEDSVLVPDACGVLYLSHITFECKECGTACETKTEARQCCADL